VHPNHLPAAALISFQGMTCHLAGARAFVKSNNPVVKEEALKSGKSNQKIMKERHAEALESAEKVVSENEIRDPKMQEDIGELAAHESLKKSIDKMMESATDPAARAKYTDLKATIDLANAEVVSRLNERNKAVDERGEHEGKEKSGEEIAREISHHLHMK
tara:strand:- start:2324 stop:2806 length:483 start_codon:yes stop_codon:yes gene_type:complete